VDLVIGAEKSQSKSVERELSESDSSEVSFENTYFSIGGGFYVDLEGMEADNALLAVQGDSDVEDKRNCPHPFRSADEALHLCKQFGLSFAEMALQNELAWRSDDDIQSGLDSIWSVMNNCMERGLRKSGPLEENSHTGHVQRRAEGYMKALEEARAKNLPCDMHEWVVGWALAVSEENASGGRVVTAPTNGSAGILPAVIKYYLETSTGGLSSEQRQQAVREMLLTAGVVAMLFKSGASISGAEVGCQGEVGVAIAMAAAALTSALGGSVKQVEYAAEMGMEHSLGLTCDPVDGLVQIPCIERNGLGAARAVTCAHLALRTDGTHHVSLDAVIRTMLQTGQDMKPRYKETSLGGLAVNVTFC
jgi:L-serine dehydratase